MPFRRAFRAACSTIHKRCACTAQCISLGYISTTLHSHDFYGCRTNRSWPIPAKPPHVESDRLNTSSTAAGFRDNSRCLSLAPPGESCWLVATLFLDNHAVRDIQFERGVSQRGEHRVPILAGRKARFRANRSHACRRLAGAFVIPHPARGTPRLGLGLPLAPRADGLGQARLAPLGGRLGPRVAGKSGRCSGEASGR